MTGVRTARGGLAIAIVSLIVLGCHEAPHPKDLVTDLPNLTRAVQAEAFYSGREIPPDRLVSEVFTKKPELKAAFGSLPIEVELFRSEKEVVVLVHSPDGKCSWLEDGSWTHYVDRVYYDHQPLPPAQFTLTPPPPASRPVASQSP